jgi:hypothetical protein
MRRYVRSCILTLILTPTYALPMPLAGLASGVSQQQVIVVAHEHRGVNTEVRAFAGFSERPDKGASLVVVLDDSLSGRRAP